MRKYLLPLLLLLSLLAAACGDDDDTTAGGGTGDDAGDGGDGADDGSTDGGGIDGTWVLTAGTIDGTALTLLDSHPITLVVAGTELSGTAACNTYFGPLAVEGGTATFGPFGATEMACDPPEAMALEASYLGGLSAANAIGLEGDDLVVTGETVSLTFAAQAPEEAAPLEDTAWVMDSLITGDTVSSVMGEGSASILLGADGSVSGSTGCNNFTGTYEVADGVITFSPLATTRKGCPDDLGAQETLVLEVLSANPAYTIEGSTLTLTADTGNGLAFTS